MTHTQGPWREVINCSNGETGYDPYPRLIYANSLHIASVVAHDQADANAELMASAPDLLAERGRLRALNAELLAALKALLRAPSIGSDGPGSLTIVVQEFNMKAARAVIDKAEQS